MKSRIQVVLFGTKYMSSRIPTPRVSTPVTWCLILCLLIIEPGISVAGSVKNPGRQSEVLVFATPTNESVFTSYLIEVFEEIGKRSHIPCRIVEIPKKRCLKDGNKGYYSGVAARVAGLESSGYENLVQIKVSLYSVEHIIFMNRKEMPRFRNLQNLIGTARNTSLLVGYMRGSKKASVVLAELPEINKVPLNSPEQAFKMLGSKRIVAYFAGPGVVSKHLLKRLQNQYPNDNRLHDIVPAFVVSKTPLFPYMHKKHQNVIPAFENALHSMKEDGTLDRLRTNIR
ncbi:transporter substrate-binding domain-containing protein [Desulforhopalus vacuolatus]|uniref:substrate-binding periplasmic protein n=1 Tax=Desulforhopalus vacuolatus TaxID=40414 RepID=UPI0019638F91|nr:transporter substrate-binding domain-containing protein [Desulforhopalus vacuolatus]MBM9518994.1 transporter substrate-binding domain-containing protein [Desulforhopalus vacuolatus]